MSLTGRLDLLRRAQNQRTIRTTAAAAAPPPASMIHTIVDCSTVGDNVLIAPPGVAIAIFEIFLWNATALQTLILKDGPTQKLVRLTGMPAAAGFMPGFAGNGEPHFRVTAGNSLLLNLSGGTQVDGFIRYKIIT